MLCISAAYAVTRCPSVRLSVTFVYSVETSKYIFNFFHRRVATPLWFFCIKRYGNIPTRRFLTGTSNAGGVSKKSRFLTNIWLSDRWLVLCDQQLTVDRAVVYRS